MSTLTPTSTPTKKRVIRDISNTFLKNNKNESIQLPPTPTKTPLKNKRVRDYNDDVDNENQKEFPPCKKKLVFTSSSTTTTTTTTTKNTSVPSTPPKPLLTPTTSFNSLNTFKSPYSQAKNLFQRGYHDTLSRNCLIGREKEAQCINEFIQQSIEVRKSNSLYISGPPGTGKTAQVNLTLSQPQYHTPKSKIVNINCMMLRNPELIFHEIYCATVGKLSISVLKKKNFDDFYQLLHEGVDTNSSIEHLILVLDELDALLTNSQQVLFKLFQIANSDSQMLTSTRIKVSLIGISNTLDLSDKFLPRLYNNNLVPKVLQFFAYKWEQIHSIVCSRLQQLPVQVFQPRPLEYLCQRAGSASGDLRKAFDMCYKAIELVELETKRQQLNAKLERLGKQDGQAQIPEQKQKQEKKQEEVAVLKKVSMSHIGKIFVEYSSQKSTKDLNMRQLAILCQLSNLAMEKGTADLTINTLYDYFQRQLQMKLNIGDMNRGEFIEMLDVLESSNFIILGTTESGNARLRKNNRFNGNNDCGMKCIKLNIEHKQLADAVKNVPLLNRVLNSKVN